MLMLGIYTAPPSSNGALVLDCTPFARACAVSTDAHGFERLTAPLTRMLADAFRLYDNTLLYVGLFAGGQIVWEGRLEDPTLYAGQDGSGLLAQALGYWRALSDVPLTALYSTTSVASWQPATTTQLANAAPERYQIDTNNRLFIAPQKNATYANAGVNLVLGALYFDLPDDASRNLNAGGIQFDYEMIFPAVGWQANLNIYNFAGALIANIWSLGATTGLQTGSIHLNALAGNPVRCVFYIWYNAAAAVYAGETGAAYLKVTNVRLATANARRVNTTWSLPAGPVTGVQVVTPVSMTGIYLGQRLHMNQGAAVNAESVLVTAITATTFTATFVKQQAAGVPIQAHQVYADDVVKDAASIVSTLNSSQLSSSTALIQSPGLDLTDESYEDAAIGDVLTHLASLGDNQSPPRQWEVGVYEDRKLFFRPQGSASRAWYVDATDLSVVRTLEDLANSSYAIYADANGRALRTAPVGDAASQARYGLVRRTAISADTTSATQAGVQASAALADTKDPKPRATIQFEAVYDAAGARYPLWLVRAGDTMTIRNLPPNISTSIDRIRTFRITHTSYDAVADTLEVEPEAAPRTLEVMLARRAEGIGT